MDCKIIKSKRKTIAIEVTNAGEVIVRAPEHCSREFINSFIEKNREWIEKSLAKVEEIRIQDEKYRISPEMEQKFKYAAMAYIPQLVAYWSSIMGLSPTGVKITSAQKRFGSCNSQNGLCFSYRIMAYDKREVDYVIVHELAHIKYKNHSKDFYALIEKYLPDYRESEKILRHRGD
ncbi:MAG: M48 family metallopeptidase [Clostridiales bacterium]|nr:M48 family metallopeptidase [Clostridiales bacterium]